jgi:hypothetical protein
VTDLDDLGALRAGDPGGMLDIVAALPRTPARATRQAAP